VARSLGDNEERHGSVSIDLNHYFGEGAQSMGVVFGQKYEQWITLFDHPDDDIYDGVLGQDDDEIPRVLIEFVLEEAGAEPIKTKQVAKAKVEKTTT
jgi:hypothetical protein